MFGTAATAFMAMTGAAAAYAAKLPRLDANNAVGAEIIVEFCGKICGTGD